MSIELGELNGVFSSDTAASGHGSGLNTHMMLPNGDMQERRNSRIQAEEPEREPLVFNIDENGQDEEMVKVMQDLKALAEKRLYHWKTFPIVLPPSITEDVDEYGEIANMFSFQRLFIAPTFDELEEVALGASGRAKKLNRDQLNSIQKCGEFEVQSLHFPGQVHRWRLSQLLQKGCARAHETLLDDAALALRLIIITAKNRFCSHFFSMSESVKSLLNFLWKLFDILIGMQATTAGDIMGKIREEHIKFLVAELDVRPVCNEEWVAFIEFMQEKTMLVPAEKAKTTEFHPPQVPYRYQTPKGFGIDLRLFNRELMQKCCKIVKEILEKESKGWHIQFKEQLITQLRGQNLTTEQISQTVNECIMNEYLSRVHMAILNCDHLNNLQPGLGALLTAQAKSTLIMEKATEQVKDKLRRHRQDLEQHLVSAYPVRSRIQAWKNDRLQTFEEQFSKLHRWTAHDAALETCKREGLGQAVYFLQRDLIFMRDREPVLQKELGKVGIPNQVFSFRTRIWWPQNYRVYHTLHGESHRIPTVVSTSTCNLSDTLRRNDPNKAEYTVQKYTVRKTSTRYPFWRWLNYLHRTWAWMWNTMFLFAVVIPWCSPVSFRALFGSKEYQPDLQLSQLNGNLCPSQASTTHTLVSRLRQLWGHVFWSRTKFESEPDTGFLGKTFTRHLNRAWNYVIKGALGSLIIVLVFPLLCLLVSCTSILAALTCPLWMPLLALVFHLVVVVIYDFDHPTADNAWFYIFEVFVWRLTILGLLQPIAAFITGSIVCPVAAAAIILFGLIRRGLRALWDTIMFHGVVKSRGRVPSRDGFVARRIAGPGLASNYFYQISPEQAIAAVEAQVELHELDAFKVKTEHHIDQPKKEYREFVGKCLQPFSVSVIKEGVYKSLDEETIRIHDELLDAVHRRKEVLKTGLNSELKKKIKLKEKELKIVLAKAGELLQKDYRDRVLKNVAYPEEDFWHRRDLLPEDWIGLGAQILSEVFAPSFLTPIEETDTVFQLKVDHLDMRRYAQMLLTSQYRDDLDIIQLIHTPKGDIDVESPFLDVYTFSPVRQNIRYAHYLGPKEKKRNMPWKRPYKILEELEKMEIPTPVPHPAKIAVFIYNRENDGTPIHLDDPFSEQLIKAAEAVPYSRHADTMGMMESMHMMYPDTPDTILTTPDHMTDSQAALFAHMAQPERAFSEDSVQFNIPDIRIQEPTASSAEYSASTADERSLHEEDSMLANECMDHYVTAARGSTNHSVRSAYDNVPPYGHEGEENMSDNEEETAPKRDFEDVNLFIDEDELDLDGAGSAIKSSGPAVQGGDTDSFSSAHEELVDTQGAGDDGRSAGGKSPAVLEVEPVGHQRISFGGLSSASEGQYMLDLSDDRESQELNSDDLKESAYV